jgi:hypothetical protein
LIIGNVAKILQRRLEALYALEQAPCVSDYVTLAAPGERERVLLRQLEEDYVELRLVVPDCPLSDALMPSRLSDSYLQLLEGVSHFVLLAERIRVGLPTSHLELELQAEVDKLVLIQHCLEIGGAHASALHRKLYGQVSFLHESGTEQGDRYRLANRLAARFTQRLTQLSPLARRTLLRRFYRANLNDKMHLSQAA